MKKGFTLAEVLITLVIIGIVAMITIPTVNNIVPDKDKQTYNKAVYTTNSAIKVVGEEQIGMYSRLRWADPIVPENAFCEYFSDAVNTSGKVNCSSTSTYLNPNFVTTDGIRFWGLEGKGFEGSDDVVSVKERVIYVDRKLNKKEQNSLSKKRDSHHAEPGMKILVTYDLKVSTKQTNDWKLENDYLSKAITIAKE